jgi:threonine synthase
MKQGIWRFAKWFDPIPETARLTVGEGNTPLVRSRRLGPSVGLNNLFFKLEFVNPTGSYKDRFACAAVSDMIANGKSECIATSSGNTGAALAAYCALAGISCEIAIAEKAPEAKLRQMLAYGAKLYRVRGFGVDRKASDRAIECL